MIELTINEARALGVLVEKAQTTPDQYPLSLNALTNGCNQKNNRDPVMSISEDDVLTAVMGLRAKGLLIQLDTPGARVSRYRHNAIEKLGISLRELVILSELLMRGPQTVGELRGRASRMLPLESIEMVQSVVEQLLTKAEPLVQRLPPVPGTRTERFAQLLCPEAVLETPVGEVLIPEVAGAPTLSQRVSQLETEVAALKRAFEGLCQQLGVEKTA